MCFRPSESRHTWLRRSGEPSRASSSCPSRSSRRSSIDCGRREPVAARHVLLATLTGREREILGALADGATTSELAEELGISPATVQTHVKNVLGKLGVHSKVEAVGTAWRAGLTLTSRSA